MSPSLRDRGERPPEGWILELFQNQVALENQVFRLTDRQVELEQKMADYAQAAQDAETALGMVNELVDEIAALKSTIANSTGTVPPEVQAAADELEQKASEALAAAQAALSSDTTTPTSSTDTTTTDPTTAPDPVATSPEPPPDPNTTQLPTPGPESGLPNDPPPNTAVPGTP